MSLQTTFSAHLLHIGHYGIIHPPGPWIQIAAVLPAVPSFAAVVATLVSFRHGRIAG